MAELHHTCPDCGSIDLEVSPLANATAQCPVCGWEGAASKAPAVASLDDFWTIERVGEVLLRVISKHGAGPMCQVFEFVGILDKDDPDARDTIMKAASAAAIEAAFSAAQTIHLRKLFAKSPEELNEAETKILDGLKKNTPLGQCPGDPGFMCSFVPTGEEVGNLACRKCGGENQAEAHNES